MALNSIPSLVFTAAVAVACFRKEGLLEQPCMTWRDGKSAKRVIPSIRPRLSDQITITQLIAPGERGVQ